MMNKEEQNMNSEIQNQEAQNIAPVNRQTETAVICWDKKKFTLYLIWSFSVAWVLQVIASMFALNGNTLLFSGILSVSMFAPLLGAVLAKVPLKVIGWKPELRGKIKYILMAWFGPTFFTILGAVLYYLIFPDRLDLTGQYMKATYGEVMMAQLESQGFTIPLFLVISAVQAIGYAPWINMVFALGEEAGWRGVMLPMLKDKLGKAKGRIVGGAIWGAWHWPVMVLAGYEYGLNYWGAPVLGMALFCLINIVMGTLLDALYEKTGCIWIPALAHGGINAIATLPILVLDPAYADQLTIGPAPIGIISVLPALFLTLRILFKKEK